MKALEEARKELENAFLVMTHLETKQSNVIKQQALATEQLQKQAEEQRQLNREPTSESPDLVSAVGALIRQASPGSAPAMNAKEGLPRPQAKFLWWTFSMESGVALWLRENFVDSAYSTR